MSLPTRRLVVGENLDQKSFTNQPCVMNGYDSKFVFDVPVDDKVIAATLSKGYLYEKYTVMILWDYVQADKNILDIGANIGVITIPLAYRLRELQDSLLQLQKTKIYSFEPYQPIYNILLRNVNLNKPDNRDSSVELYNMALSHKEGKVDFVLDVPENNKLNYGATQIKEGSSVIMNTLDSLKIKNISIMKVDVEGAEKMVFYGAKETIKNSLPVIVFERNDQKAQIDDSGIKFDIIEYCSQLGYDRLCSIPINNYILLHKSHFINERFFQQVNKFPINFSGSLSKLKDKFKYYKMVKISWS